MSKIKNSVYGLALGDALGYRTEFLSFQYALLEYGSENIYDLRDKLLVSDDTQMSLYLLHGFANAYDSRSSYAKQEKDIIVSVASQFLNWLTDPENCRAPGNACIGSMRELERAVVRDVNWGNAFVGGAINKNSKGSGTVMRSPWLGLLNASGAVPDESLESMCNLQSSLTHQHPTALHASYLTALLTSKLFTGELAPGQLQTFSEDFCASQPSDLGWRELATTLRNIDDLPTNYKESHFSDCDASNIIGANMTAENVLVTSIAYIDYFGDDAVEVLRRSMFNSGDSDTIGATAGGMIGAYYDEPIWDGLEHLIESYYVPELDWAVAYIEKTQGLLIFPA
jgi:ADP-ribosylglycohydrolase